MSGYASPDSADTAAQLANDQASRDRVQDGILSEMKKNNHLLARILAELAVTNDGPLPDDGTADFLNAGVN